MTAQEQPQLMQCMEVWGGNQAVETTVAMPGLDAWIYSLPHGQSSQGGDVYYVSSCATGRIARLLVADVAGHGSAVGKLAIELRAMMRKYVNYLDQSQFVQSMNDQFAAMSEDGCFATALVTTFFAPTNHLTLCNAGHPPPLLYRALEKRWQYAVSEDEDRVAQNMQAANLPLGVLALTDYEQFDLDLETGDLVLCYTDSLIEARTAPGSMLGFDGLLRILQSFEHTDPATLIPSLLAAVASKGENNLAADDVTTLLFRPNGQARRTLWKHKLLAPGRLLCRLAGSALPGGDTMSWPDLSLANLGGAIYSPLNRAWRGRSGNMRRE